MKDLTVVVISWKRPHLLRETLASIKRQAQDIGAHVVVVDNETNPETRAVIEAANVDWFPLDINTGINWPLQHLIAPVLNTPYVCVSDHDLYFARPFSLFVDFLRDNPDVAYVRGGDSPEHVQHGERVYRGERWLLKRTERGGGLMMSSDKFRSTLPLPRRLIDWDWHCVSKGGTFACLPGAFAHIGYRDSTWYGAEVPEKHVLKDGVIVELKQLTPCSNELQGVSRTYNYPKIP